MYEYEQNYISYKESMIKYMKLLNHDILAERLLLEDRPNLDKELNTIRRKKENNETMLRVANYTYNTFLSNIFNAGIFNREDLFNTIRMILSKKYNDFYDHTTEIIDGKMYNIILPDHLSVYEAMAQRKDILFEANDDKEINILNNDLSLNIYANDYTEVNDFIKNIINDSYLKKIKSTEITKERLYEYAREYNNVKCKRK